jgi:hypothetical protein
VSFSIDGADVVEHNVTGTVRQHADAIGLRPNGSSQRGEHPLLQVGPALDDERARDPGIRALSLHSGGSTGYRLPG